MKLKVFLNCYLFGKEKPLHLKKNSATHSTQGEAAQTAPHPHPHAGHLTGEASLDDGQIYDMSDLC